MRILVVGSGGREHAICWALRRTSKEPLQLFCAPGNAGIAQIAECISISADDLPGLGAFAQKAAIDFTMVGPEVPLALGIVDEFESRGLRIVGPTRAAARLESSKSFAKDFMLRHSIPTARYATAHSVAEAEQMLKSDLFGNDRTPVVIKADGLAAGKGVFVAQDRRAALDALRQFESGALADGAAERIVIEEMLNGREVSLLLFSDGHNYKLMPPARDHKRIGEGDTGPNTGGMGAVTDDGLIEQGTVDQIVIEIVEPTLQACRDEGFPFKGILFIGLMLTANGPRVLEYNVRFGDPETQAILVRLKSDLAAIFQAIIAGRLSEVGVEWSGDSSACVVLAAKGYPAKSEVGTPINGLDLAATRNDVAVFHAATSRNKRGEWSTAGGRVLGVTAKGSTLEVALARSYDAIAGIHWDGMQYRRDIGRSEATGAVGAG